MHPIATQDGDGSRERASAWGVARWLITAAAALVLVTLFLTQATGTEAAAPPAASDDAVILHDMATCPAGFNCAADINACVSGNFNFCGVNLGFPNFGFAFGSGLGCALGNLSCNLSFVNTALVNPVFSGCSVFICPNFTGFTGVPNNVFTANGCPVGNFACLGGGAFVNGCPVGNFSCLGIGGFFNGCPVGNFSCLNGFPFFNGFTGTFSGNVTVVAPGGNVIPVGPPLRVREVAPAAVTQPAAQPVAAPVAAAPVQVAEPAPAVPAANYATALNAPQAQAPAATVSAGGAGIHVLSAAPATTPAVSVDTDDHRG